MIKIERLKQIELVVSVLICSFRCQRKNKRTKVLAPPPQLFRDVKNSMVKMHLDDANSNLKINIIILKLLTKLNLFIVRTHK